MRSHNVCLSAWLLWVCIHLPLNQNEDIRGIQYTCAVHRTKGKIHVCLFFYQIKIFYHIFFRNECLISRRKLKTYFRGYKSGFQHTSEDIKETKIFSISFSNIYNTIFIGGSLDMQLYVCLHRTKGKIHAFFYQIKIFYHIFFRNECKISRWKLKTYFQKRFLTHFRRYKQRYFQLVFLIFITQFS